MSNMACLIVLLIVTTVTGLQIPDQQAYVGKVFYYRLPLGLQEMSQVKQLVISESSGGTTASETDSLPHWLLVRKSFTPPKQQQHHHHHHHNHSDVLSLVELIGIPSNPDRRMHFFHIKLVNSE